MKRQNMADEEHLAILKKGAGFWNEWRDQNRDIKPDLFGAQLAGFDLEGVNFEDASIACANLRGVNLSNANLAKADIGGDHHSIRGLAGATDLQGANLFAAHLFETNFNGSDLRNAVLRSCHLHGAVFIATQLAGADLTESKVSFTTFNDVDLRKVVGLDAVRHDGPSTIDINTIFYSAGQIDESFLRGAGVPETLI